MEDWLSRWLEGRIGWHEAAGNTGLRKYWPATRPGTRVLVPLCGKSQDLLWLADAGCSVTGIELSNIAIEAFFAENNLRFKTHPGRSLTEYRARDRDIRLYCGDYFDFEEEHFDGLYDRGALVALPPDIRPAYVEHTDKLLNPAATRLVITLEYDQSRAAGPPFSVMPDEVLRYWPDLVRVAVFDETENAPARFRAAGSRQMAEVVWRSN